MENDKLINRRLKEIYGISLDGKPFFRLVWSEDLIEKRFFDIYNKTTPSGIWLGREENVVKEVKKYSYLKDRWILEVHTPEQVLNPEIRNPDTYEPLFVFQTNNGEYLKPIWFAVQYACQRYIWAKSGNVPKRTEKMDASEDQEALEKETRDFEEYLKDQSSDMMNKFRYQEAVIIHKGDE